MTDADQRRTVDRADVTDLLVLWARAIDFLDWDTLRDHVFAEDVTWEWRASDGRGSLGDETRGRTATVAWFARAIQPDTRIRHVLANHVYSTETDTVRTTSYMQLIDSATLLSVAFGLVTAEHIRTDAGWRIRHLRVDEQLREGAIQETAQAAQG